MLVHGSCFRCGTFPWMPSGSLLESGSRAWPNLNIIVETLSIALHDMLFIMDRRLLNVAAMVMSLIFAVDASSGMV